MANSPLFAETSPLYVAAVSCNPIPYCTGGVKLGLGLTGKLGSAWVGVHGSVKSIVNNKKDSMIDHLNSYSIDICALQETEIVAGFPEQTLDCHNFKMELENNDIQKRAGFYIKKVSNTQEEKTKKKITNML